MTVLMVHPIDDYLQSDAVAIAIAVLHVLPPTCYSQLVARNELQACLSVQNSLQFLAPSAMQIAPTTQMQVSILLRLPPVDATDNIITTTVSEADGRCWLVTDRAESLCIVLLMTDSRLVKHEPVVRLNYCCAVCPAKPPNASEAPYGCA